MLFKSNQPPPPVFVPQPGYSSSPGGETVPHMFEIQNKLAARKFPLIFSSKRRGGLNHNFLKVKQSFFQAGVVEILPNNREVG
jgi:hypothetical protein